MNTRLYEVEMVSGKIHEVNAFNKDEAIILAQAEAIKLGNKYEVRFCQEKDIIIKGRQNIYNNSNKIMNKFGLI